MLLTLPGMAFAKNTTSKSIPVKREKRQETEIRIDPWGHRTPSAPIICTVSETHLTIAGIDNSQFSYFEAYDVDGILIASFFTEAEFISFLLQSDEEIELRIYTDDYVFSGWW